VDIERTTQNSLGIERVGRWQYGVPASQSPPLVVYATDGEQNLLVDQAKQSFSGPGSATVDFSGKLQTKAQKTLPTWVTEVEPSVKDQKLSEQFLTQLADDRPVLSDAVAATEDESPVTKKLAIFAVKALGDLSMLTPILNKANDPIARQSASAALRD